jgi:hypothetical protein
MNRSSSIASQNFGRTPELKKLAGLFGGNLKLPNHQKSWLAYRRPPKRMQGSFVRRSRTKTPESSKQEEILTILVNNI